MAVEILWDSVKQVAAMWDNTTDQAFGPVFSGPSAEVEVQEFLDWLRQTGDGTDPRHFMPGELAEIVNFWCNLPTEAR